MTKFSLEQAIFPKGSEQKRLTELVKDGFYAEGPFFIKIRGGNRIVYEPLPDRNTTYILTNGENYSTYLSNKIMRRNKV